MLTLHSALLAQHPKQLTAVRCAEVTIAQLHRYFEDVVLENSLAALVVESMLPQKQRSLRDMARVRELSHAARYAFFFVSDTDGLNDYSTEDDKIGHEPTLLKGTPQAPVQERFVVIADARFSALLAAVKSADEDGADGFSGDEVIWS